MQGLNPKLRPHTQATWLSPSGPCKVYVLSVWHTVQPDGSYSVAECRTPEGVVRKIPGHELLAGEWTIVTRF